MEIMKRSVSYSNSKILKTDTNEKIVYRVNWLRARARAQRWSEEKEIVKKEMEWVIRTFRYMESIWETRGKNIESGKLDHKAYAAKETDRWYRWAETAKKEFVKVLGEDTF